VSAIIPPDDEDKYIHASIVKSPGKAKSVWALIENESPLPSNANELVPYLNTVVEIPASPTAVIVFGVGLSSRGTSGPGPPFLSNRETSE
jgi:hypothetical protein